MRILVHEFVSGGGLAGMDLPPTLAREGAVMRDALVADLAAIGGHEIAATIDARLPLAGLRDVRPVPLAADTGGARLHALIASADAVWIVAPETRRCLERLAATVESLETALIGSGSSTIRRSADKGRLAQTMIRQGLQHPRTRVLPARAEWGQWTAAAREVGYPVVVKPRRGAGCVGVARAEDAPALRRAVAMARRAEPRGSLLLQRFVPGVAASVSLLGDGRRAVVLAVNAQHVVSAGAFSYDGGITPLEHPLAPLAAETAVRACEAVPGLRGYFGVDVVLTDSEVVVIEVNARLTTSYLGVRAALSGQGGNVAALAIAACSGTLPARPIPRRCVRFTADGRVDALRLPGESLRETASPTLSA